MVDVCVAIMTNALAHSPSSSVLIASTERVLSRSRL